MVVFIDCKGCGLPVPAKSAVCWRCNYPVVYSMAPPVRRDGLSELSQAVVLVAVFAVVLVGIVSFHVRNEQIAAEVGPAPTLPAVVAAGTLPRSRATGSSPQTPTARPTPAATPTATAEPVAVLPRDAAVLDRGDWAVINADDVLIRTQPFREGSSEIIGDYDAGSYVEVLDGPTEGSGYYWFLVDGDGPTGWVAAGTAVGAWIVRSDAPATLVGLPNSTASIPGAEIVYYDIVGTSPAQLREQISRYGPPSSGAGGDIIATAEFVPEWADVPVSVTEEFGSVISTTSYYVCDMSWSFVVTVPRWVAPAEVSQPAAMWWQTSVARIVEHEATHVRIWQEAVPQLEARLAGEMPCYQAIDVLSSWLYEVDAAQAAFDADHGYLDWPSAPSLP